jgi:hypothetical protein
MMPAPSILADGHKFFVNVLNDKTFQKRGFMTRTEGRLSWGVVDPRRHVMTIWEKGQSNFESAALARNATLITNGPFLPYDRGNKYQAFAGYQATSLVVSIGFWVASLSASKSGKQILDVAHSVVDNAFQVSYFSTSTSEGYITGTSESISERVLSRPNADYFGRDGGRLFANYVVANGDPPVMAEVIGGLKRSVRDYIAVDPNDPTAQLGCWGLAPLLTAPEPQLEILKKAGLEEALEAYSEVPEEPEDGWVPIGEGVEAADGCDGLIVALFGGGRPPQYANILAQVLVKEAVRVDGNASILLASGGTGLQGVPMPYYKQKYNRWGYQFGAG